MWIWAAIESWPVWHLVDLEICLNWILCSQIGQREATLLIAHGDDLMIFRVLKRLRPVQSSFQHERMIAVAIGSDICAREHPLNCARMNWSLDVPVSNRLPFVISRHKFLIAFAERSTTRIRPAYSKGQLNELRQNRTVSFPSFCYRSSRPSSSDPFRGI